jgi:hypothetical protein
MIRHSARSVKETVHRRRGRGPVLGVAISLGAFLLVAQIPAYAQASHLRHPFDFGFYVADFDNDRVNDLAKLTYVGASRQGHKHRVEVHFEEQPGTVSFSFFSAETGVRLVPTDVDRDGDTDLVITTALTQQPIGVWINDGEGRFEEGNLADYQTGVDLGEPVSFTGAGGVKPAWPPAGPREERSRFVPPLAGCAERPPKSAGVAVPPAESVLAPISLEPLYARPPPFLSLTG